MDERKRFRGLRIMVIIMLAFLVLQYEFGMAFTLSDPPELTPFGFSGTQFNEALNRVGPVAQTHAGFGILVGIMGIVILVASLRSKSRGARIVGPLAFLAVLVAGITGQLFVQSGYQNDGFSHGMATFFIVSFILYFVELYLLKPTLPTRMVERV